MINIKIFDISIFDAEHVIQFHINELKLNNIFNNLYKKIFKKILLI
jgi:hypothetical protein